MSSPNIVPLLSGHVIGSSYDAFVIASGATAVVPQARSV